MGGGWLGGSTEVDLVVIVVLTFTVLYSHRTPEALTAKINS